jgi:hypothetical protein
VSATLNPLAPRQLEPHHVGALRPRQLPKGWRSGAASSSRNSSAVGSMTESLSARRCSARVCPESAATVANRSGKIGLGLPPLSESNPLRLRINRTVDGLGCQERSSFFQLAGGPLDTERRASHKLQYQSLLLLRRCVSHGLGRGPGGPVARSSLAGLQRQCATRRGFSPKHQSYHRSGSGG